MRIQKEFSSIVYNWDLQWRKGMCVWNFVVFRFALPFWMNQVISRLIFPCKLIRIGQKWAQCSEIFCKMNNAYGKKIAFFCWKRIVLARSICISSGDYLKAKITHGVDLTTLYYYSANHQSGLKRNTFFKLSYIFLIHQNVPQIISFDLRYLIVA